MAAPKGNKFWEARSKHGRDKIFSSPDALWEACVEYFEWNEENPLWEIKSYMYQGAPVQDQVPKMRAMTKEGLVSFLGISVTCWNDYKSQDDFSYICTRVEEIIRRQKFEGAASEFFNHSIIARDLGLADKKEVKSDTADAITRISSETQDLIRELAGRGKDSGS